MKQMLLSLGQNWGNLDQKTIERENKQLDLICGTIVFLLYVLTNFLADLILIQRNSAIWHRRRLVVWLPLCVSIVNNAVAIIGVGFEASDISRYPTLSVPFNQYTKGDKIVLSYLIVNTCLNFGLTGCLAGRIWWIGRITESALRVQTLRKKYNSAVAITLESGILYPIALIVSIAVTFDRPTTPSMYPFLVQVVGIAPTLIIVRTVLGLSVEQTETDSSEDRNSTMLNTYPGAGSSDEKIGIRTAASHRSSFGSRFAIPLHATSTHSQIEKEPSIRTMQNAGTQSEHHAAISEFARDGVHQRSHSEAITGANDASQERAQTYSQRSKPKRPLRTLPAPRGARAQRSIDETTTETRSQSPPLNIIVHTSVEQVSEYHPRFKSFS
ncbi:hypothetical protein GYMLUDRAFT_40228 [Collybiopsis luxurians FD-317 M1]|uniref:Uncharacterized protein n=1 Tax=Collybiopsis luxurians FD-317 M1 TaxID=944289 RepID=A0A0D0CW85_9AGAR|nr:hypothetical protein GYMLUDRAFT_40228 [Collybiopsis luxurians FD-317 M1]